MSDLSHDSVDDGFHEIQLSGKQLVALFMITTVIAVVIFICGVLVGRDVRPTADAAAALAANVATEPEPAAPAPAATATPSDTPTPVTEDPLTYQPRLENERVPEQLKARSSEPETRPEPPAAAPAPAAAPPAAVSRTEPKPEPKPEAPAAAANPPASRSGTWIVQVAALSDRSAAGSIQKRLSAKGYPAFVVTPPASAARKVYKVQVGRYADRSQADQVARRLETEEKLSPWISR